MAHFRGVNSFIASPSRSEDDARVKDTTTDNSPVRLASLVALAALLVAAMPARALTATTVNGSASPGVALSGNPVRLSATVGATDLIFIAPISGTVTFSLGASAIPGCTAVPFTEFVTPTTTSCTFTPTETGYYTITTEFSGNGYLEPSSNYFELRVPSSYPVDSPLPLSPDGAGSTFGALVTSNPVGLTGFTGTRTISVTGGQYSIGCANYTTAPGTVKPGDILCVRHVTPPAGGVNTRTTVTLGAVESNFDTNTDYWYDAPYGQEATVAAGISHTVVQPQYSYAVAWGDNTGGKLGNGTTASSSIPTEVLTGGGLVAAGLEHSLMAGFQTFAMGLNTAGQLGVAGTNGNFCTVTGEPGSFPCYKYPNVIPAFDNAVGIGAGWRHSVALKSDGTVWAWGSGFYGQNGKTADQSTPALVAGINGTVVRIAAGYMHSVALLSNGTVVAWGSNQFGELGPDVVTGTGKYPTPVPIPGLTDVVDIAAGASYTLALKSDGTVWSWGANIYGQLGDPAAPVKTALNTAGFRATPTKIPGLSGVRQISAGFSFALARKFDGTIVSWGLNHRGQANGTPQSAPKNCGAALGWSCILSPTPVPGSANYQQVYAGGAHSVLVDSQWRLKLFGDNSSGQLANRSGNFGAKFTQTTYDPDTFLNPAGVGGTPANVGRSDTGGSLNLGTVADGIDFGSQGQGIPSAPVVLSLNNLSATQALLVSSITATGDDVAGEFAATHNCPASLPANTSCLINLTFTPTTLYNRTGSLEIVSNATDSNYMNFRLTGDGVDPRASSTIALSSPSGFSVVVGTPVTFDVTVTSSAPVTGTVTFGRLQNGSYPSIPIAGCVDVPVVSDSASCTTSTLPEGYQQVIAGYSGSATVQPAYIYNPLGISITPVATSYLLTVAGFSGGNYGSGTVSSAPAGINNCVACSAQFPIGAVVTLTATPATGSIFAGWGGDCAGTGTCVVTMSANRNVLAPFTLAPAGQATLTVARAGSGSGTVASASTGISCGATCVASYDTGASVTLTATPAIGSIFSGWGGACSGTGPCTVTMSAARNVTAYFSLPATVPRLGNLSTRMAVGGGDNVLIGGLVIGGTQPKTVVVRARGPSLAAVGVAGAIADPTIELYSGQTLLASNDDWKLSPDKDAIVATGFQPLADQEAAVIRTLPPGGYTAIVRGAGGATGVALVEAFEVDLPQAPLINIATRGFVGTGDNVMIGGFVILGDAPQTVIVRASGPSLAAQGVSGALANPVLRIQAADASILGENDDWKSVPNAASLLGIYAPASDFESALRLTLPPGGYTAIVSGAGAFTGVALIEVFAVPAAP